MSKIVFEAVENNRCLGKRGGFELLIDNKNGYVNATKLCIDNGKRYENWRRNKENLTLLQNEDVIKKTNALTNLQETYLNTHIIRYISYWISFECAIEVNSILDEYNIKKEKEKIKELEFEIAKQNEDLTDKLSKLSLDNEIAHEKLNEARHTLNIVVKDRVVKPKNKSLLNTIMVYEFINKKGEDEFHVFRVQLRSAEKSVKAYLKKQSNAVKFDQIDYNANAVNYFVRFKEQLGEKVNWKGKNYNNFTLKDNMSKDQLKEFIDKINNDKYILSNTN